MTGIIHKYFRRTIRWLNTPSQEELEVEAASFAERQIMREAAFNEAQRNRVLRALAHKPLPGEYATFGPKDLSRALAVIKEVARTGQYPKEHIAGHLLALERAGAVA